MATKCLDNLARSERRIITDREARKQLMAYLALLQFKEVAPPPNKALVGKITKWRRRHIVIYTTHEPVLWSGACWFIRYPPLVPENTSAGFTQHLKVERFKTPGQVLAFIKQGNLEHAL